MAICKIVIRFYLNPNLKNMIYFVVNDHNSVIFIEYRTVSIFEPLTLFVKDYLVLVMHQ